MGILLSACGGGGSGELLPGTTADQITSNLDHVRESFENGDCEKAEIAVAEVSTEIDDLRQVDVKLKNALKNGAAKLSEVVSICGVEEREAEEVKAAEAAEEEQGRIEAEEIEAEEEAFLEEQKQEEREEKAKEKAEKEAQQTEPPTGGEESGPPFGKAKGHEEETVPPPAEESGEEVTPPSGNGGGAGGIGPGTSVEGGG